jgi:hypothetical protein
MLLLIFPPPSYHVKNRLAVFTDIQNVNKK